MAEADYVDFGDTEYAWPPGELPPATGPQLVGMRLDSIEGRLAILERGRGEVNRQLLDIQEAAKIAVDALTYLSGAVERVRVLISENGTTDAR
jgi:hypothetical protein